MKANRFGTPQGGVISPLLANIYLHPLDEAVNEQCRDQSGRKPRMVRYADDLVILCHPGEGEGIKERLRPYRGLRSSLVVPCLRLKNLTFTRPPSKRPN
jgi:retron-type reverse transcriptase